MDESKLAKIRQLIDSARGRLANLRHNDLAKIAKLLGRKRSSRRTNEPTYESVLLNTNVITIPDHSRGLNRFTAKAILMQLEKDVMQFEVSMAKSKKLGQEIIDTGDRYDN